MKLLAVTAVATAVALILGGLWSGHMAEARVQLGNDGLAISGIVMAPGTRGPRSGTRVVLRSPDGSGEPRPFGPATTIATTTSDSGGRFSFDGLTSDVYLLATILPGDADETISVVGESKVVDLRRGPAPLVELWLPEFVPVSGRIVDSDGEPMRLAEIDLRERVWSEGRWVLHSAPVLDGGSFTDEDGRYEVRVAPGDYYLWVNPGPCCDALQPTYYPGVSYPEDAAVVSVRPGAGLGGMNVKLRESEDSYAVEFGLTLPDFLPGVPTPRPLSAYVDGDRVPIEAWFLPRGRGQITDVRSVRASLEAVGENVYRTSPMPPGQYDFRVEYSSDFRRAITPPGERLERPDLVRGIARLPLTLADRDLDLGMISATPLPVSGRVRAQGDHASEVDLEPVALLFADAWGLYLNIHPAVGRTFNETFHRGLFRALPSGFSGPTGWYIASIRSGARDVLSDGLEIGGGPMPPLEVVIADDGGRIEGIVRRDDNSIVPDARIVLVPPPSRRGPMLRFPTTAADVTGAYAVGNLPPGEYRLLALDVAGVSAAEPYWEAPDFLRKYELRGERITVDPGARMTINAQAIPVYE